MNLVNLSGKKIVVGVTGSISAYKACDLVRLFVKSGADVKVVMSESAQKFVSALTFEALTKNEVLTSSSESWSSENNHIDIVKDADLFVMAPATANSINKLAKGIADTLVLQAALAAKSPVVIAPAANTQMLQNHYTVGSLKMLRVNDVVVVEPQSKKLVCGVEGSGALANIEEIYYQSSKEILTEDFWKDRKVVVTGGGTKEPIDTVRYISNYSSGKMAEAVVLSLYLRGADVCYITTTGRNTLPDDVYIIDVESAKEMLEYTVDAVRVAKKGKMTKPSLNSSEPISLIRKMPYLFMVAAVSDYSPKYPQDGKLKKSQLGDEWCLELVKNPDILEAVDKNNLVTVAFKAESDKEAGLENAKEMLIKKGVDAVCYNHIADKNSFGSDTNAVEWITKDEIVSIPRASKYLVAGSILNLAQGLAEDEK